MKKILSKKKYIQPNTTLTPKFIANSEIKFHFLSNHQLSNNLSREQLNDLCTSPISALQTKAKIFFLKAIPIHVFLVLKGVIKISEMSESGIEMIKEVIHVKAISLIYTMNTYTSEVEHAVALTDDTVICSFNRIEFEAILTETRCSR